nr:sodium/bile acid cotransporter 7-B/bile acid cotransporter 7-B [Cryptococcus depauperatus CBS 7841]
MEYRSATLIADNIDNNAQLPKVSAAAATVQQSALEAPVEAKDIDREDGGKPWYHPLVLLDFVVGNWFFIGIGVAIILAWRFPRIAAEGGVIRSEYSITYGAIGLIFLITGLTLSTPALLHQLANYRLHLFAQVFSFLFFPAIVFAIVNCVKASGNTSVDKYALVGMVVMSVMPTTVASNITMTRSAGGSVEAATMEVCVVGNLLGAFITPLLCEMFFSNPAWSYGMPVAKGGQEGSQGLKEIYRQLAKQLGLALFIPLSLGQVLSNIFPRQTKWAATTFRLSKVSTFLLLLLIWSVFSTQFGVNAFESISHISVIFICFVNFGLYVVFTIICVFCTRLPFFHDDFDLDPHLPMDPEDQPHQSLNARARSHWRKFLSGSRFDKKEATAICFCAAAKGMVVGAPTLSILYGGFPKREKAILSIPLVLYQGQQVAVAQILVYFFKKWNEQPDRLANIRKKPAQSKAIATHVSNRHEEDGPDTVRTEGVMERGDC